MMKDEESEEKTNKEMNLSLLWKPELRPSSLHPLGLLPPRLYLVVFLSSEPRERDKDYLFRL